MRAASRWLASVLALVALSVQPHSLLAQSRGVEHSPDRAPGEGEGPFERLIIRGATVIDGTGAPARGPMDIVIEGNRIVSIQSVGPRATLRGATRAREAPGCST